MFEECYPRFAIIVSALNFRQASNVDTVIGGSLLDTKRLLLLVGLTCSPRGSQKILSAWNINFNINILVLATTTAVANSSDRSSRARCQ